MLRKVGLFVNLDRQSFIMLVVLRDKTSDILRCLFDWQVYASITKTLIRTKMQSES